jgi:hypothetical protein
MRARALRNLLGVAILASACGDASSSPDPVGSIPPPPAGTQNALAGTWTGTIVQTSAGTGTLRVVLSGPVDEVHYSGSWTATFSNPTLNLAGNLSGEMKSVTPPRGPAAVRLEAELTPAPGRCSGAFLETPFFLSLGIVDSNRLRGTGVVGGCDASLLTGEVEVVRR